MCPGMVVANHPGGFAFQRSRRNLRPLNAPRPSGERSWGEGRLVAASAPTASAVATASAPAAAARSAASAPAAAAFLGTGLVDRQSPAFDLLPIEGGDGSLRFLVAPHLHEAESLGPPGVPIHDDLSGLDRAVRAEQLRQR